MATSATVHRADRELVRGFLHVQRRGNTSIWLCRRPVHQSLNQLLLAKVRVLSQGAAAPVMCLMLPRLLVYSDNKGVCGSVRGTSHAARPSWESDDGQPSMWLDALDSYVCYLRIARCIAGCWEFIRCVYALVGGRGGIALADDVS